MVLHKEGKEGTLVFWRHENRTFEHLISERVSDNIYQTVKQGIAWVDVMSSAVLGGAVLILQIFCLVEEEVERSQLFCINLVLLFEALDYQIRNICNLINSISYLVIMTTEVLKSTFEEDSYVDRL